MKVTLGRGRDRKPGRSVQVCGGWVVKEDFLEEVVLE